MPTNAFFEGLPPFPSELKTLDMPRISYAKLEKQDAAESKALYDVCLKSGFFLLDFSDTEDGRQLLKDMAKLFAVAGEFFAQSVEKKKEEIAKTDAQDGIRFKPMGIVKDRDGQKDSAEMCSILRSYVQNSSSNLPAPYAAERDLLNRSVTHLHAVAMTTLSCLATELDLPADAFEQLHALSAPSDSQYRQVHYPPRPEYAGVDPSRIPNSLRGHTDNGSLTILFTGLGGLQVLPPGLTDETENWAWVRPEPHCAIVNVGDSLVQYTGGLLESSYHRVWVAPGPQAALPRYSIGYFLKPADEAPMRRLKGGKVPSYESDEIRLAEEDLPQHKAWHRVKYNAYKEGKNLAPTGDRGAIAPPTATAVAAS